MLAHQTIWMELLFLGLIQM
uniref:Uncharacterized protein n=1 Tax=Rhizophora mucronata TaxID=61149 RepID=A0A2P2R1R1_RHIMU